MNPETKPFAPRRTIPALTFQNAVESFLLRCRAQNLSPLSILWYKGVLKALARFLDTLGIDEMKDITPNLLREHFSQLREKQKSGTVFRTFGGLRCFFSFLSRERLIPASPMSILEKPRKERVIIPALSLDQMRILLAQPSAKTFEGIRSRTLMVLILDTGLRVSEAMKLRRDQVDFQGNTLRVMGKGGKERDVPFGTSAKQVLWQYIARVGSILGQDLFFVNQFGRGLNANWFQKQLREYGKTAGLQGVRVSPHTLRHTFATQYILNGGDAFSLQKMLGHSTLDMVRIYVDLANRDVALQHKKYSPIDHLGVLPGARRKVVLV